MDKKAVKNLDGPITEGFFTKYMDNFAEVIARGFNDERENNNKRFDIIDNKFREIDKRFEQIDKKFEQINKRFELLSSEMHLEFHKVHKEMDRLEARIKSVNKSRTEDIDALGDDILKHERQIKVFAKRLTALEKLSIKN